MSASLRYLGATIAAFRKTKGLTQQELAAQTTEPINRSLVAHLEQGLRLPSIEILTKISSFLEIPPEIIAPYLTSTFQKINPISINREYAVSTFKYLAVSGPSGSGKSTLARSLARAFGIPCIPIHLFPKQYLPDLAKDPGRWALETQLAFLVSKAMEIKESIERSQPFILDRTLSEDVLVYAKYWENEGHFTPRSVETYKLVSEYLLPQLPEPDLTLYCDITLENSLNRVKERQREDLSLHTDQYLRKVYALYDSWIQIKSGPKVVKVDSNKLDWRMPMVTEQICFDIERLLRPGIQTSEQLSLFPQIVLDQGKQESVETSTVIASKGLTVSPSRVAPIVYIAAPFTAVAIDPKSEKIEQGLFPNNRPHGTIPKGEYRELLFLVERALKDAGLSTILPHRDVNEWGRKTLTSKEAMAACTRHVELCDLFVGFPGTSTGAHYEFGLARGLGKPCILLFVEELASSFLAQGISALNSHDSLVLNCRNRGELNQALRSEAVTSFLARHLDLVPMRKQE